MSRYDEIFQNISLKKNLIASIVLGVFLSVFYLVWLSIKGIFWFDIRYINYTFLSFYLASSLVLGFSIFRNLLQAKILSLGVLGYIIYLPSAYIFSYLGIIAFPFWVFLRVFRNRTKEELSWKGKLVLLFEKLFFALFKAIPNNYVAIAV